MTLTAIRVRNSVVLTTAGLVTRTPSTFSSLLLIAAGVRIFIVLSRPVSQQWFASPGAR